MPPGPPATGVGPECRTSGVSGLKKAARETSLCGARGQRVLRPPSAHSTAAVHSEVRAASAPAGRATPAATAHRTRRPLGPRAATPTPPRRPAGPTARPLTLDQLVVVVLQRGALLGHGRRPGSRPPQPPLPRRRPRLRTAPASAPADGVSAARLSVASSPRAAPSGSGAGGRGWRRRRGPPGPRSSCWRPGIP